MKNKMTFFIGIIAIALMAALFVVHNKSASYQDEIVELNSTITTLETENELLSLEKEVAKENTFDDDIEWFMESVYGTSDSRELYDEINEAITEPVAQQLFGETLPPEASEFTDERSVDRTVSEIEIYGDYIMNDEYKALVKARVSYVYKGEEELSDVITEINLLKDSNDVWRVSKFEEKSNE